MLVRNIVAAAFLLAAGMFNGLMDSLQFHYSATPFAHAGRFEQRFWNPAESWKNKYRNGDPAQGEAFPGAKTVFVFATDGWHLFKFLMLKFIVLAVVVALPFSRRRDHDTVAVWAGNALLFVAFHLCFQAGFTLAYI